MFKGFKMKTSLNTTSQVKPNKLSTKIQLNNGLYNYFYFLDSGAYELTGTFLRAETRQNAHISKV